MPQLCGLTFIIVKMNTREQICRLCLKEEKNKFTQIDKVVKQMFNILLLNLNLDISRDPVICQDCIEMTRKCLGFKSICFGTEGIVLLFSTTRKSTKHDIKDIYREMRDVEAGIDGDLDICRFCMTRIERSHFTSLGNLSNEMFEMLLVYMPEMDLDMIKDPTICTTCRENLEGYLKFTLNCLDMERQIKAYCKDEGTDTKHQIKLSNVLHSSFRDIVDAPQICTTKEESIMFEDKECVYPDKNSGLKLEEELDIKIEDINLKENYSKDLPELRLDERDDFHPPKKRDVSSNTLYKCLSCSYETKRKGNLVYHMLVHKDVSEIKMNSCTLCDFETKHKRALKRHLLVHKDISELKMQKCPLCDYETKHKGNVKSHMLTHKDDSERIMHNCPLCTYASKWKHSLKQHMLVHRDVSEIKMHKCSICDHQSRLKSNIKKHMLKHKDISEIVMHKCSWCDYEAKQRGTLRTHMLVHKDVSEIVIHKCSRCAFESKWKHSLRDHSLLHNDVSE